MSQPTPVPGKLGAFLIGATAYLFNMWRMSFALETGNIKHFDANTDGNNNYWPTFYDNFATAEGEAGGAVDHAGDLIPIGAGLYIGSAGTATCLHRSGNGFTAPIKITGNDESQDAGRTDPALRSIKFILTGPPTRVYAGG